MHLKNDSNQFIHINFKNCLEKITEMKKKHCYLIDENFHDLAALKFIKLFSKYECCGGKFILIVFSLVEVMCAIIEFVLFVLCVNNLLSSMFKFSTKSRVSN